MRRQHFGLTLVDTLISLMVMSMAGLMVVKAMQGHAHFRVHGLQQVQQYEDRVFTRFQLHRLMHQSAVAGCRQLDETLPVLNLTDIDVDAYRAHRGRRWLDSGIQFLTFEYLTDANIRQRQLHFERAVHLMADQLYALSDCRLLILWRQPKTHFSNKSENPIPAALRLIKMQPNASLFSIEEVGVAVSQEALWLKSRNHKSYRLLEEITAFEASLHVDPVRLHMTLEQRGQPVVYEIQY